MRLQCGVLYFAQRGSHHPNLVRQIRPSMTCCLQKNYTAFVKIFFAIHDAMDHLVGCRLKQDNEKKFVYPLQTQLKYR